MDNLMLQTNVETDVKGYVFNIQHYSIHDGPGIRTTVFINGCPLRCLWCQNPESQDMRPQLFFIKEKCTGCGKCVLTCQVNAISIIDGLSYTDRKLCNGCGKCVEVCPNEARSIMGREMTAKEVFDEVYLDAIFYEKSGGGVTISGGEPLSQPDFVKAILKLCKNVNFHTAIDTSGYAKWETFKEVLKYVDMVLYDFKHMDPEEHRRCTGVSNKLILENAIKIRKEFGNIEFVARIPVIPGYNDTEENIIMTARFIARELGNNITVHLLPYHGLGEVKYARLDLPYQICQVEPPSDDYMEKLRKIVTTFGLKAVIGG